MGGVRGSIIMRENARVRMQDEGRARYRNERGIVAIQQMALLRQNRAISLIDRSHKMLYLDNLCTLGISSLCRILLL